MGLEFKCVGDGLWHFGILFNSLDQEKCLEECAECDQYATLNDCACCCTGDLEWTKDFKDGFSFESLVEYMTSTDEKRYGNMYSFEIEMDWNYCFNIARKQAKKCGREITKAYPAKTYYRYEDLIKDGNRMYAHAYYFASNKNQKRPHLIVTFHGKEESGDGVPYWLEDCEIYLPKQGYEDLENAIRAYLEPYIAKFNELKKASVI